MTVHAYASNDVPMLSFFDAWKLPAHPCRSPALTSTFSTLLPTGNAGMVQSPHAVDLAIELF